MFIAPIPRDFTQVYPKIVLDLVIDDTVVDLVAEGYDAAIRIGEVIARDMVMMPLGGKIRQIAVASPGYVAEHGQPATPRDLFNHQCIRWRWPGQKTPYAWEFCEDGRLVALLETWSAPFPGFHLCYPQQRHMAPALAALAALDALVRALQSRSMGGMES